VRGNRAGVLRYARFLRQGKPEDKRLAGAELETGARLGLGFGVAAGRIGRAKGSGTRNCRSWS
jgi:hypothetical protein